MMADLAAFLILLILAAWLGNQIMRIDAAVAVARGRIRSVKKSEGRLRAKLGKLTDEEAALKAEIEELVKTIETARRQRDEAAKTLAEAEKGRRQRLFVLSERRLPGDGDWVVRIVNEDATGAPQNVAKEWGEGREYLVWAKTEDDANRLALRRFSARTGSLKAVHAEQGGMFPNA